MLRARRPFSPALLLCVSACLAMPAADEAIQGLASPEIAARRQAARALGRMGDTAAVPALIKALKDADAGVRADAARALGHLKRAQAVPGLIQALADPAINVRINAAYALGEIKDGRAAAALLKALTSPSWHVRDQAAWALRELGDAAIAPRLVAMLDQPNADVDHVIWILRGVSPEQTSKALATMSKAPDGAVRRRAVALISALPAAQSVDLLCEALRDPDATVRAAAVTAVKDGADERALPAVQALIERETDAQILELARDTVRRLLRAKGLAAHWSFDDGTAKDMTGWGTDGEINGATPCEGKVGRALQFDGKSHVALGKPAELPIGQQPFTVTAWVKLEADSGVIVARGGAWCGYSLFVQDGVAKFGIHRMKDGPGFIAAGEDRIAGAWAHVAGVVRKDRVELFVNGAPAATAKTPGYIPGNTGQGMEIGFDAADSSCGITDHFVGIIDEVRAYGIGLTPEQIAKQYAAEK